MSEIWVCNASPVILLGKIERLDLISSLGHKIVIPNAVVVELISGRGAKQIEGFIQSPDVERIDGLI